MSLTKEQTSKPSNTAMESQPQRAAWPAEVGPEVARVLDEVAGHLTAGRPSAGLAAIGRSGRTDPWLTNAAAVCHLRAGNAAAAVTMLRGLVLDGVHLRETAPAAFKLNFAAALLATGNVDGYLAGLRELRDGDHPSVPRHREAVRRWKAAIPIGRRMLWAVGGSPPPLDLGFPAGDLA